MISQQFYLEEAGGFGHESKYKSFTAFGWSVVITVNKARAICDGYGQT